MSEVLAVGLKRTGRVYNRHVLIVFVSQTAVELLDGVWDTA